MCMVIIREGGRLVATSGVSNSTSGPCVRRCRHARLVWEGKHCSTCSQADKKYFCFTFIDFQHRPYFTYYSAIFVQMKKKKGYFAIYYFLVFYVI